MRNSLIASLLLVGACVGGASEPKTSSDSAADQTAPRDPGTLGGACAQDGDCDSTPGAHDGLCYHGWMGPTHFPEQGYCTVDDGSGAICDVDADCPAGGVCVDSEGYKFCALGCSASFGCPAGDACLDSFNGFPMDQTACVPGNASAQDGDACGGFYDCGDYSDCNVDAESPGGQCAAFACTPGNDSTCNGGTCEVIDDFPIEGAMCVDTCASDSDCRTADGYACYTPAAGAPYCRHPHVGDACQADAECGDAAWACLDGRCTIAIGCPKPGSTEGCTSGSICAHTDGGNECVDRCATIGNACANGLTCSDVGATGHGGACL
jgi:hypothetical protein